MNRKIFALSMLLPLACWAHLTHNPPTIWNGLIHPFTGWDHMLTLLAVGWVAYQQKNPKMMTVLPASFMGGLLVGAGFGVMGFAPSFMEYGIAVSLVCMGAFVAFAAKAKFAWPLVLVAGLFHGFAHGAEMPNHSSTLTYFSGFLLASFVLMFLGLQGHHRLAQMHGFEKIQKVISGVLIASGIYFLLGLA